MDSFGARCRGHGRRRRRPVHAALRGAEVYDSLYQKEPARAARLISWLLLPTAFLVPLQFFMPNPVLFAIVGMFPAVLTSAAFAMTGPLISSSFRTACAGWDRRSARSTSSSSGRPVGRCCPAS